VEGVVQGRDAAPQPLAPNVPSTPNKIYKDAGWQECGRWLGTGNTEPGSERFLPFGEAVAVARSLNLANRFEWRQWSKEGMRPSNVPSDPNTVCKDGRVAGVEPLARHR